MADRATAAVTQEWGADLDEITERLGPRLCSPISPCCGRIAAAKRGDQRHASRARRECSAFQIGLRSLRRCLANDAPVPVCWALFPVTHAPLKLS